VAQGAVQKEQTSGPSALTDNRVTRREMLRRAHEYAQDATRYHDPKGNIGFVQCFPSTTSTLLDETARELRKMGASMK
jgi:hypothetical protein